MSVVSVSATSLYILSTTRWRPRIRRRRIRIGLQHRVTNIVTGVTSITKYNIILVMFNCSFDLCNKLICFTCSWHTLNYEWVRWESFVCFTTKIGFINRQCIMVAVVLSPYNVLRSYIVGFLICSLMKLGVLSTEWINVKWLLIPMIGNDRFITQSLLQRVIILLL